MTHRSSIAGQAGGAAPAWWLDAVAAWQGKGAASYAASLVNLANPGTYDAATGVLPAWDAGVGWTFNGSTYLNTTLTAASTAWSMAVRFAGVTDTNGGCGYYIDPGSKFFLRPSFNGQRTYANGRENVVAGAQSSAVMIVAGKSCYLNGSPDGTIAGSGVSNGNTIAIGRINAPEMYCLVGSVVAMAVWSRTLTPEEAASVSDAMEAL